MKPFLTIAAEKNGLWLPEQEDYEDWKLYRQRSLKAEIEVLKNAEHGDFGLERFFKAKIVDKPDPEFLELNARTNQLIAGFFDKHLKN